MFNWAWPRLLSTVPVLVPLIFFWGSYSVAIFGVVYVVRRVVGGWSLRVSASVAKSCGRFCRRYSPSLLHAFLVATALPYLLLLPSIKADIGEFLGVSGFAETLALVLVADPLLQLVWPSIREELLSDRTSRALWWAWAGSVAAVIVFSSLFALGHYGLYSSYGLSPLGVAVALAYRSLVANITMHTLTIPCLLFSLWLSTRGMGINPHGGYCPLLRLHGSVSQVLGPDLRALQAPEERGPFQGFSARCRLSTVTHVASSGSQLH